MKRFSLILLLAMLLMALLVVPVVAADYSINTSPYPPVGNWNWYSAQPVVNNNAVAVTNPGIDPTRNPVYAKKEAAVITEASVPQAAAPATAAPAAPATAAPAVPPVQPVQPGTNAPTPAVVAPTPAPQETLETVTITNNNTPLAGGPAAGGNPDAANGGKTNPKTGDNTMGTMLLMGLAVLAGAGIIVTLKLSKKQSS